jgi:hypothetical protein
MQPPTGYLGVNVVQFTKEPRDLKSKTGSAFTFEVFGGAGESVLAPGDRAWRRPTAAPGSAFPIDAKTEKAFARLAGRYGSTCLPVRKRLALFADQSGPKQENG